MSRGDAQAAGARPGGKTTQISGDDWLSILLPLDRLRYTMNVSSVIVCSQYHKAMHMTSYFLSFSLCPRGVARLCVCVCARACVCVALLGPCACMPGRTLVYISGSLCVFVAAPPKCPYVNLKVSG
jgi:hypothetical protein